MMADFSEPEAWTIPSPRELKPTPVSESSIPIPLLAFTGFRSKASADDLLSQPPLTARRRQRWQDELSTLQADIKATQAMIGCHFGSEKTELTGLRTKVHNLACGMPVSEDKTLFCGVCGSWYSDVPHECDIGAMGDLLCDW